MDAAPKRRISDTSGTSRVGLDWAPTWFEIVFIAFASIVLFVMAHNASSFARALTAASGLFTIAVTFSVVALVSRPEVQGRVHEAWSATATVWLCFLPWLLAVKDHGLSNLVFVPIMALAFETPSMTARQSRTWRYSALLYTVSYASYFLYRDERVLALVALGAGFAALSGMGFVGQLIRQLISQRDENHELAHTDVLTGLHNRRGWGRALEDFDAQDHPSDRCFTCVVFDLDHFKRANERFGHLYGDALLRQVASSAREALPEQWVISRVGGDEFAAIAMGDRRFDVGSLRQRILERTVDGSLVAGLSMTCGIAVAETVDEAWVLAVGALRSAKRTQRGSALFAGQELDTELAVQKEISSLSADEVAGVIGLVAQPIVENGQTIAYECLARWRGTTGENVGPDVFVPIFEEAGLAHMLGRVVVQKAIEFVRTLPEPIWVSVNISPSHFQTTSFAAEIARLVASGRIAPSRLTIEVTESEAITDHETWVSNAARLRRLGLGVAVDDFGAGWSSLDRLIQLNMTALKVDRGIVAQLGNPVTRALLAAVAAFADAIGIRLIAEGVETEHQTSVLTELGFRSMQGYLYGRPADLEVVRREVWDEHLPITVHRPGVVEASTPARPELDSRLADT